MARPRFSPAQHPTYELTYPDADHDGRDEVVAVIVFDERRHKALIRADRRLFMFGRRDEQTSDSELGAIEQQLHAGGNPFPTNYDVLARELERVILLRTWNRYTRAWTMTASSKSWPIAAFFEPLMTVEDLSNIFLVARKTVRAWCANGKLKPVRLGRELRFHRRDVERLLGIESTE